MQTESVLLFFPHFFLKLKVSIGSNNTTDTTSSTGIKTPTSTTPKNEQETIDELLLDGHLNITKELLLFQNAEKKYSIGCSLSTATNSHHLINDLVEHFIFPASYLFKKYRDSLISAALASPGETNQSNLIALNNVERLLSRYN